MAGHIRFWRPRPDAPLQLVGGERPELTPGEMASPHLDENGPIAGRKSRENTADDAGKSRTGSAATKAHRAAPGAAQVAALVLLVGELQRSVRDLRGEVALLRAQVASLLEPAPVPDGYVCLKIGSRALRRSPEWLRRKCEAGALDCKQIGGKRGEWYIRLGGTEERSSGESGGKMRP
jgi:hypothetical protein